MVVDAACTDVRELERRWRAALQAKDVAALRRLIHPDFRLIGIRPHGPVCVDLEQWLVALDKMDIATVESTVIDCIVLDDAMVATVDARWKVRYRGQLIDERVLVTDVWVRHEGEWRVVRRHSSPVPSLPRPASGEA